jgi:hypothetical protein
MESPFYRELNKSLRSRNRKELKRVFFPALKLLLHALIKLPQLSMTVYAVNTIMRKCLKPRQVYRGVKHSLGKEYLRQRAIDREIVWSDMILFAARGRTPDLVAGGRFRQRPRL